MKQRRPTENEDRRVAKPGAGNGQSLSLPTRETRSLLAAQPSVVTLGQITDEVVDESSSASCDDLLARNVLGQTPRAVLLNLTDDTDGDVVMYGAIEENRSTL